MSKPFIKFSWNGKWKTVSNHFKDGRWGLRGGKREHSRLIGKDVLARGVALYSRLTFKESYTVLYRFMHLIFLTFSKFLRFYTLLVISLI